jgi:hypothetical protein
MYLLTCYTINAEELSNHGQRRYPEHLRSPPGISITAITVVIASAGRDIESIQRSARADGLWYVGGSVFVHFYKRYYVAVLPVACCGLPSSIIVDIDVRTFFPSP